MAVHALVPIATEADRYRALLDARQRGRGLRGANITITLAAAACLLSASAAAQLANVSPVFVDFGEIKMGGLVTVPVTIRNLTPGPLSLAGGGIGSDVGFSALGGTCAGGVVPADSSCQINYRFRPKSSSATVEAATVLGLGSAEGYQSVSIQFRGTGGESLVQVSPRGIDFGEEQLGQTIIVPVTITNTHTASMNFAGGGIAAPFGATGGAPSCAAGVAAGASCVINYRFTPNQIDEVSGSTTVAAYTDDGLYQEFSIAVRGRGRVTPGIVGLTWVALDFGDIKLGREVESLIHYSNRTASALNRAGGGFNDNDGAFFSSGVSDPNCVNSQIPAGYTCSSRYRFRPVERREHAASTAVQFSQTGAFAHIPLNLVGRGVGTLARLSPVEVDFGEIRAGTLVNVPVTLTNTSEATLINILGGAVSGAFSRTTDCSSTLAVAASCVQTYRFLPPDAGDFQALTVLSYTSSTGIQESVEITLSGRGTARVFANGFE